MMRAALSWYEGNGSRRVWGDAGATPAFPLWIIRTVRQPRVKF